MPKSNSMLSSTDGGTATAAAEVKSHRAEESHLSYLVDGRHDNGFGNASSNAGGILGDADGDGIRNDHPASARHASGMGGGGGGGRTVHQLCPYLDTINRHVLDFDFEKLCSVSLSKINVYACLVCGKYFQGRGPNTYAYTHSVSEGHHVFLNLQTLKFYCLPDNYVIIDSSLDDIKFVLNPVFSKANISTLDMVLSNKPSRAIDGSLYLPSVVGLNNIKANDYCNVVLQALSHVTPLRDYFLEESNYSSELNKRPPGDVNFLLVQRFGELLRKLWNPRNFKVHVSPHEMLQAVVLCSKKKFQFTEQGDPVDFLSWLLNALHLALNGTKGPSSSIIYRTFLGRMNISTRKMPPVDYVELDEAQRNRLLQESQPQTTESNFLLLTCDLPPQPLFKDEQAENIIPQVNLYHLLSKFNGTTEKEYKTYKDNFMKKFHITKLPPYLILCFKRFAKNTFFIEKNPTIVNFPIKGVELSDIVCLSSNNNSSTTKTDSASNNEKKRKKRKRGGIEGGGKRGRRADQKSSKRRRPEEERGIDREKGIKGGGAGEMEEDEDRREGAVVDSDAEEGDDSLLRNSTTYDLIANIVHDGEPNKGSYRAHILHKASGKWFEMQDLHVVEILPQMITLTESYIQIYEQSRTGPVPVADNNVSLSSKDGQTVGTEGEVALGRSGRH